MSVILAVLMTLAAVLGLALAAATTVVLVAGPDALPTNFKIERMGFRVQIVTARQRFVRWLRDARRALAPRRIVRRVSRSKVGRAYRAARRFVRSIPDRLDKHALWEHPAVRVVTDLVETVSAAVRVVVSLVDLATLPVVYLANKIEAAAEATIEGVRALRRRVHAFTLATAIGYHEVRSRRAWRAALYHAQSIRRLEALPTRRIGEASYVAIGGAS